MVYDRVAYACCQRKATTNGGEASKYTVGGLIEPRASPRAQARLATLGFAVRPFGDGPVRR
jgi:hypothetical protein